MPQAADAVRRVCPGAQVSEGRHFCRAELDRFRAAAKSGDAVTVTCTQEAPLFTEAAAELGVAAPAFVNIRETAGWSRDAHAALPKMAALAAAAAEPMPDVPIVALESNGVALLYGRDERVIEAARLLQEHLDLTVLLTPGADVAPPHVTDYPVVRGTIRNARGALGEFEVTVDKYATPLPSSRSELTFGPARDGAVSRCDLIVDLSGGVPLFPAADLRDGYVRADPGDAAAVLRAVLKARDLVGGFEKPRYIAFRDDLCAHARSGIVGCHRCLDLCPTGAIAPAGSHVAIDPNICAGCGQCAAACPTGAAAYALPPADFLLRKLRTLLAAYGDAGGRDAVILFHDGDHGAALIEALARFGDGLPANVLPVAINEITQVGLEAIAAALAYGAGAVRFLLRAKSHHDVAGLHKTLALAKPILAGLGFGGPRAATIETDDPDALGETLRALPPMPPAARTTSFAATGGKREVLRLALRELHGVAPAPQDVVALPADAPFGTVIVNTEGCTLCLSCVSACPTGALSDDPEKPMLRFAEDACVQCGLCRATCPEKVISLKPQLDFRAATALARVIKQEEPYACIRCAKPFGVKSTIERVAAKLEGKHWMYKDSKARLDLIRMCDDCRIAVTAEQQFDPFGAPPRPRVRTTDDYLRDQDEK
ncbi:MAG TPA: 4Fe-4S binding protein [Pseudolabrys sp.]|nr:4Fe-4S binding protein [Pseudolabrys sp.]